MPSLFHCAKQNGGVVMWGIRVSYNREILPTLIAWMLILE
ncbi:MAG: hypothetical protein JWN98_1206 [Abditibacteriota bacterium]|nr:hypothetical protein [Abditibacteriota bacterium]